MIMHECMIVLLVVATDSFSTLLSETVTVVFIVFTMHSANVKLIFILYQCRVSLEQLKPLPNEKYMQLIFSRLWRSTVSNICVK